MKVAVRGKIIAEKDSADSWRDHCRVWNVLYVR
jgi:hypothetical protein